MMRTTILVTALLVSMLSASAAYAQKVETALDNGYPVINCEGMPSLAHSTTTKGSTAEELKTATANATVYKRFAVHKSDNSNSSTWTDAFTFCTGGWRLPTQRELMLVWVLKGELEKTSGFTPFSAGYYWSATENGSSDSWYVYFTNGYTNNYSKTYSSRVRCVRDL